jgi:hypothetical protein
VREFTMRAPGNGSGSIALIRKLSAEGSMSYHVMGIDNKVLGEERVPALALASPNVVLFDSNVLQKGYIADTTPKQVLEAAEIPIEAALNTTNCEAAGLNLRPIKIVIEANKLHVKNIERQWFESKLLLVNDTVEKPWQKMPTIHCSGQTKAEGNHAVDQDSFKKLLKRSAKHDKGMALKVEEENVSVTLVLDKKVTQKILGEVIQS